MSWVVSIVILISSLIGCPQSVVSTSTSAGHSIGGPQAGGSGLQLDEYSVYEAVIRKTCISDSVKLVVISDTNIAGPQVRPGRGLGREPWNPAPDVTASYERRRKHLEGLKNLLELPVNYVLISEKEEARIFSGHNLQRSWQSFYDRYPNSSGIIAFSRVGFNAARDTALVYVTVSCGGLCGHGDFILLRRNGQEWVITATQVLWVS